MVFFNYLIIAIPSKCTERSVLMRVKANCQPSSGWTVSIQSIAVLPDGQMLGPCWVSLMTSFWEREAHVSLLSQAQSQKSRCQHNLQKEIPRAGANPASTELCSPDLLHEAACGNTWCIFTEAERCQRIKQKLSKRESTILIQEPKKPQILNWPLSLFLPQSSSYDDDQMILINILTAVYCQSQHQL